MRYFGLDLGTKTLGIAISDERGIVASPFLVISFKDNKDDKVFTKLNKMIIDNKIDKIVLGLPKNMNNSLGERARETLSFKSLLEEKTSKEVILEDERWTTLQAERILIKANMSRQKRKKRIDKLAATIILQTYLDKINRKEN